MNLFLSWVMFSVKKVSYPAKTAVSEILVPYLNNYSEETIYGGNKIKEQDGTMKFQNEFYLKSWLLMKWNRPSVSA